MRRTLVLFVAGVVLAGAVMYLRDDGGGRSRPAAANFVTPQPPAQRAPGEPSSPTIELLTLATGPVGPAERARLQRLLADSDRQTLEPLAEQVAALPPIEGRRLALEALFARYAELDAPAAAAYARKLGVPAATLGPLFATWARNDASGALQALAEFRAPAAALTLGIAVLEAIGNDALGIARVLEAAPQIDADRFRVEAALAKAADDPGAALDDLLGLPRAGIGSAFERLAAIWIDRDVHGAIASADELADEGLRDELKGALTRMWARLEPDALVDYLIDADPERRTELLRLGALEAFALVEPARALRAAEAIPGDVGALITRAALMSVARENPLHALQLVATLPPAADRTQLRGVIATSYGRADPEAALAWAQGLQPPAPNVVANVLAGIAQVDPDRALEILFRTLDATRQRGASPFTALLANGALSAEHTAALAARLLSTPGRSPELAMLTRQWAQRQPHDAVRWLLANEGSTPRAALAEAAEQLARRDPAAAIGHLDDVRPELRATWLHAIAGGYAQNDARAAASWIALHRGETGYDAAVVAIAGATAANDPAAAARLFGSVDTAAAPDSQQAAQRIASAWARQDQPAAAAWAAALPDEGARTTAVGEIAAQWAQRDAAAARGWALGLPPGAPRDGALTALLGAADTVDHVVLDAYSSPEAQQRGVGDMVRILAARDPAAARQLADRYLTDPGARRAASRFIERRQ
jgi:hypothetical protein